MSVKMGEIALRMCVRMASWVGGVVCAQLCVCVGARGRDYNFWGLVTGGCLETRRRLLAFCKCLVLWFIPFIAALILTV